MNPVNWFEIPVADMPRARKFYSEVFGYEMAGENMGPIELAFFPMAENEPGIGGGLSKSPGRKPGVDGVRIYFSVADIDGALAKVAKAGGAVVSGRTSLGPYGFMAEFTDTEGNLICLHTMAGM